MPNPACFLSLLLAVAALPGLAQAPVRITVDAAKTVAPYTPDWNFFGADEPNYTYAPNGTTLLKELSAIDPAVPVYFRPHNLLTSGDGSGSLKWGSTGVYKEAADGSPVYDWTITDKLFDNLKAAHVLPMVEIGFMPEALSPHPVPYRHDFPAKGNDIFTGWSYPPKDDAKWRALIVAYATHLRDRYGAAAVAQWKWEVWNEPDIPYFHGTVEEYEKLYDVTTGAIRQVLPQAVVGGPGVTGGGENKHFLQLFLEHCARGVNADSGKTGAPLDFISFHPKGSPKFKGDHVVMNLGRQLAATDRGFQTIASFLEYRRTPIILSETDPEGCAACQGPQNGYRNGPLYGVSVAEMLARSAELARLRGVNLEAGVTWAFEFEGQAPFAGFRELATSGSFGLIDKPVLNVFRMFGKLSGSLVALTSTGAVPVEEIVKSSVTGAADVNWDCDARRSCGRYRALELPRRGCGGAGCGGGDLGGGAAGKGDPHDALHDGCAPLERVCGVAGDGESAAAHGGPGGGIAEGFRAGEDGGADAAANSGTGSAGFAAAAPGRGAVSPELVGGLRWQYGQAGDADADSGTKPDGCLCAVRAGNGAGLAETDCGGAAGVRPLHRGQPGLCAGLPDVGADDGRGGRDGAGGGAAARGHRRGEPCGEPARAGGDGCAARRAGGTISCERQL